MMAIGSDDESECGWSSRNTAGKVSDSVRVELSPLASSSHLYPISLERVAKQTLDLRAKRAAFDGLRGLRQLRLRVENRFMWFLRWNGCVMSVVVRTWASLTRLHRRPNGARGTWASLNGHMGVSERVLDMFSKRYLELC